MCAPCVLLLIAIAIDIATDIDIAIMKWISMHSHNSPASETN